MIEIGRFRVPLAEPRPDVERFIRILMGRERADRPPLVEYIVDPIVMRPVLAALGRAWVEWDPEDSEAKAAYLDNFAEFWHCMGYDFVRFETSFAFQERRIKAKDTAPAARGDRWWADEHHGAIGSWEDFERFPWPGPQDIDLWSYEYLDAHLPEGMGLIVSHGGGVYEHLSWIMSYEGLCLALYDQPDLVAAVAHRIGTLIEGLYERLLELRNVVAVFQGDDMGFRTATLVSPAVLRQHVLPWHRRFAAMAHARGLPYFLHSCGNVEAIMDELIEEVGIDGKHSFEDAILPALEFQRRHAGRVAVLGGVDVNVLAGDSPDEVRRRVRELIDACGPLGRFAIGSGNSIPSYVPVENYLAMLDEALH